MAKTFLFDIESDGLLDTITTVWCAVIKDVDTNEVFRFRSEEISKAVKKLLTADTIIGHNIIAFDLPALGSVHKMKLPEHIKVIDTLVCCRTIWPDIQAKDTPFREKMKKKGFIMPDKYFGSHSLGAWGWRLGYRKTHHEDWSKFSEEMLEYCWNDVEVNHVLLNKILEKDFSQQALDLEHKIHAEFRVMQLKGVPFDTVKAAKLASDIQEKRYQLLDKLVAAFPAKEVQLKTKVKVTPFNPSSRQQIGDVLLQWGWKPKKFSPTGKPVIDESTLASGLEELIDEHPEIALLDEYLMLSKRIGQISTGSNAWLKLEQGGVIHGAMNHMGAVTSRCAHMSPNMGQVPASHSPYGKECRELFYAPKGYKMVGSDLSGLELRMLAHYLHRYDNGAYGDIVLNGDIHTANQNAAGLPTRDMAKTFIYGFLYGAGAEKVGKIVGKGKDEGQKLINRFLKNTPALKMLREAVQEASKKGYLILPDGRRTPVRSQHAALNTLLQGAGAIVAKTWYCYMTDVLRDIQLYKGDNKYPAVVLFVHDEVQCIVQDKYVDEVIPKFQEELSRVERHLRIKIPLACEVKVGQNWYETH